jgi:serine/threonine-protein kinase RsbW
MDKLELKNILPEINHLRAWIEAYGAGHNLSPELVNALLLSMDELVTNIISYGYSDSREHIITVTLSEDEYSVTARLEDDAKPFNPLDVQDVDITTTLEEKPIGRLGIHLVKKFMDTMHYERSGEKNILTMNKKK